jgi:hypothetical protein
MTTGRINQVTISVLYPYTSMVLTPEAFPCKFFFYHKFGKGKRPFTTVLVPRSHKLRIMIDVVKQDQCIIDNRETIHGNGSPNDCYAPNIAR